MPGNPSRPAEFAVERLIRFQHCDPAGIVFYPQYLFMVNELLEDWFEEHLGIDYGAMFTERRIGIPTVRLECDFLGPSRVGDRVRFSVRLQRIGSSSFELQYLCVGAKEGDIRVRMRAVLVFLSLTSHNSLPVPEDIRAAMEPCLDPVPGSGTAPGKNSGPSDTGPSDTSTTDTSTTDTSTAGPGDSGAA
ncbi:acyl-CoA thioesterase [Streptomyces sp. N2-109]|uniref:Acyl-CoA thioesterase n=1 Tax=Streptomyces gossypii TaxID=2883101 RepID=A0ABT2JMD4_9ACTN|nr:thioesterase family protein [Streptomyces gossypii]MCT2588873.1 acyl-CoA thioesterase [Streptomyces gossypii]